jgi:predicted transposase/invertase (TIGR01784 family)
MNQSPEDTPVELDFEAELATHPNDAWFKQAFSKVETARALFCHHLPAEIVSALQWDQLQLLPASFVRTTLQQSHSDLLFSVPSDSGSLMLYLLFEHQTTVDQAMPLRLLGYMTEIWNRHEKEHGLPLPPILPLVLHQGPERWTASCSFQKLLFSDASLSAHLTPFMPEFRHLLLDLTQHCPDVEETDDTLRIILQLMKLAREKQRLLEFFDWLDREAALHISQDLFRACLLYALHTDQNIDFRDIYDRFHQRKELQSSTMTIAQKLRNEGRQEGIQAGRQEGIQAGRQEGIQAGRQEGIQAGVWIGRLQTLQEIMGRPLLPDVLLAGLSADEVRQQFEVLQAEYHRIHKA